MSEIIGLNDNKILRSDYVYDESLGKKQSEINQNVNSYKFDYPDTLTYTIRLGQDTTWGIVGFATASDRIHFTLPTYPGYSKVNISFSQGSGTMANLVKQTSEIVSITSLTDYSVHSSGVLHVKPIFASNTILAWGYPYAFYSSNITLTITLSK